MIFNIYRTAKASIVLLSAKMLNVGSLHGVRHWIVGAVLVLAGVVYAIAAVATCVKSPEQEIGMVYECHPPTLLVASSMASKHHVSTPGLIFELD